MFCINISWLVCTFVAVATATDYIGEEEENFISEPVLKVQPSTGVELAAAEAATVAQVAGDARLPAHGSPEPPAQTSSTAPAFGGSSPYAATQPHSSRSSRQSPATAASTVAGQTVPQTDEDRISFLRSLSPEEKGSRLTEAAEQGELGELEALLAAGADVGARGGWWNWTALHWAAAYGRVEAARRLLAAGAAVDARDDWQGTPLHVAARGGDTAVARLLLAANADHGARERNGRTPLHLAAFYGHTEAAAALVEAGADRAARDNRGRTPLDLARESNQQHVVQLLEGNTSLTATTSLE